MISNNFRSVFLNNTFQKKALFGGCAVQTLHFGNDVYRAAMFRSSKTRRVILSTEHVKWMDVFSKMMNCVLLYSSKGAVFSLKIISVREKERRRFVEDHREIPLVGTNLLGTFENPLVGSMKIPFMGTFENPLVGSMKIPFMGTFQNPLVGSMKIPFMGTFENPVVGSMKIPFMGTFENPLVGSMKIPFMGTVESPLVVAVVKMIQNAFEENSDDALIFWNGKGDFSTSSSAWNGPFSEIETQSEAVENHVSHIANTSLIHDCNFRSKVQGFQHSSKFENTTSRSSRETFVRKVRVKRDREPSRINVKKVIIAMKSKVLRQKVKATVRKTIPRSSRFYYLATNYKICRLEYVYRSDCFFSKYLFPGLKKIKHWQPITSRFACFRTCLGLKQIAKQKQSSQFLYVCYNNNNCNGLALEGFYMAKRRLLLSGDIELNPGPIEYQNCQNSDPGSVSLTIHVPENSALLVLRLNQLGLRPLEVGGNGDCFFRAVSHQVYGVPDYHLNVRARGVQYLIDHPERFIESTTDRSWISYLNNMSRQGTWCDAIIIQAVAESMNLIIHIVESHHNFAEQTIIQPLNFLEATRTIYIGHLDEFHYVSTIETSYHLNSSPNCDKHYNIEHNNAQTFENTSYTYTPLEKSNKRDNVPSQKSNTCSSGVQEKHRSYMREYMRKRRANESDDDRAKRLKAQRAAYKHNSKERKIKSQYQKRKIASENTGDREKRLQNNVKAKEQRLLNESSDSKIKRLEAQRRCRKQQLEEESEECRKRRLKAHSLCQKQYIAGQSSERRNQRLRVQCEYYHHSRPKAKPLSDVISLFHNLVSKGPLYVCSCCDQLWYRHSVILAGKLKASNTNIEKYFLNKLSVNNQEWLCKSCHKYLTKNKVPPQAAINGLQFPKKPDFFDLNELECRLVAPRLAFQKLLQAPRGKQFKISGNVVNVPADITDTVHILPRVESENATIKVQLKRRLKYKSSALSLNVRPYKVLQAAKWLALNSSLYREEGVTFNDQWKLNDGDILACNSEEEYSEKENSSSNSQNIDTENKKCSSDEEWSENEAEFTAGVTDTMLTATDFLEDNEREHIFNIAPGEGSRPLSIFKDKYSEELAYPGIFLGQQRPENEKRLVNIHYSDICKSELRRSDRRAIFF